MKQLLFILMAAFLCGGVWAQCPTGDITLSSQSQIDNFATDYPGCTEILGAMIIDGVSFNSITNLNGLSPITAIQGDLRIIENYDLISFGGLDNLTFVGGDLESIMSFDVIDLTPLSNLTSVGGDLRLSRHLDLISLAGLESLTSIGGTLVLSSNYNLPNLNGLISLTSVGGGLIISDCNALVDLSGLENLTSISGEIRIIDNDALTYLNGLDNLDGSGITYLTIERNSNLTFCSVTGICDYLTNGGASTLIFNAFACDDPADITYSCVSPLPCPKPGILFRNQQQIDNFPLNYPTCTAVSNITIVSVPGEAPVKNLNGLSQITSITGNLYIHNADSLQTLTGLNNVISIGGYLQIGAYESLNGYYLGGGNNSLYSLEGLNSLVTIGGDLEIFDNHALTDLTALNNLTSIGGQFKVNRSHALTDFTGLENLTSVGDDVWIDTNDGLTHFTGLEGLVTVGGRFLIGWNSGNDALISIEGLSNLTSTGSLNINNNLVLSNLTGFENLTTVNGYLWIYDNDALADLSGLQNLTSVSGYVSVYRNTELSSIAGLSNINYSGIANLSLFGNPNLSECSISSICDYLDNGGILSPFSNATGCNTQSEIEAACTSATACPTGDITFSTQQQIDDFATNYPNCTEILGSIEVNESTDGNITSLSGLSQIVYIGGNLEIISNVTLMDLDGLDNIGHVGGDFGVFNNDVLTNLAGLEGLTSVEGGLTISTGVLTSLTGLNNVTTVGGELYIGNTFSLTSLTGLENLTTIGSAYIYNNYGFSNLTGLENLTTVEGDFSIDICSGLNSLEGLESITTIGGTLLLNESALSFCSVPAICNYLQNGGAAYINGNAPGCNTQAEVEAACIPAATCPTGDVFIGSQQSVDNFAINYPECTVIEGDLWIFGNHNDIDLSGLNSIMTINGDFRVELSDITNFSGLNNLETIGGGFIVEQNDDLINFQGLESLTTVGGNLNVFFNYGLESFSGLENVTSIGGRLTIRANSELTSLQGIENIDPNVITNLYIEGNDLISVCNIPWICEYLANGGSATISGNAPGCDSVEQVQTICSGACSGSQVSTDSLSHIYDQDLFIDGIGFANNPSVTFTDPATPANAVLSDISLELYFRLNGNSCENEIAIQITDPAGNTQALTAYTSCDGGTGLYYVNLDVPTGNTTGSTADWIVKFDDTNDQNSDYEYSVRFARLNYVATTGGGEPIVNEVSDYADSDLFIDGVGFENNGTYTFTDPGTPADAVLSDISLELYFRLNGNSCENEIAIQLTDPAGNPQALTAYKTCDGGTGLYYVNLDVPNGNTTGSTANWTLEFDDTNDQNSDYEYSVRFGRLTYTTTHTQAGGTPVIISDEVVRTADSDLFIDGIGFGSNPTYTFYDPGTPDIAELSDISLELYFRLNGASCENEIAIQLTDPAGNTQPLTAYTTCDGGTGLYYVNLDVPNADISSNSNQWTVQFDDTNDQNSDYEYSVRFGRLTYTTQYNLCDTQMMIVEENEENTSAQQHVSTQARQHVSTSTRQHNNTLKLYPVPATQYLNVEYFSEINNPTNIEIISNEGKILMQEKAFSQEGINTSRLDIAQLPAGHYHIRIYNTEGMQMQSFIKIAP